jgi:hypothetical protein
MGRYAPSHPPQEMTSGLASGVEEARKTLADFFMRHILAAIKRLFAASQLQ